VVGGPDAAEGRIDLPLGRLDPARGWWMRTDETGQPAATTWRVLGRSDGESARPERHGLPTQAGPRAATGHAPSVPAPLVGEGQGGGLASAEPAIPPPPQPSPTRGEGARPSWGQCGASASEAPRWTWLALEPLTGRTHQLRVHCAAMGWPIVGDNIY